jgi:hypothetical protein
MSGWFPRRRFPRLALRLSARLEGGGKSHSVTVLSLSEGGFYCEGLGLDVVTGRFDVAIELRSHEPCWRPRDPEEPWRGDLAHLPTVLRGAADVLYVDLHRREATGPAAAGLGARFVDLPADRLEVLREFIDRELFRVHEWRTRGGAVHAPPRVADLSGP